MCGIIGRFAPGGIAADQQVLAPLVDTLVHRGPDGGAWWADGPFFLGHRRLAIIELSPLGVQPMATDDGDLVVTFNGEIYNFVELRQQLQDLGHRFRSGSDTEVLLHGYRQWGSDLPARLVGMFAFGIADRARHELFLARDRFGEKPLLVAEDARGVTFASEMRPLAMLPWRERRIDEQALASFLCLNYVAGSRTLLEGVGRVAPGTWRRYQADGRRVDGRFYDPHHVERRGRGAGPDMAEAMLELERRLDDAVRLSLRSDVPVGVLLSGGIDSSLVATSASRAGRLTGAYCLTFAERSYSEWDKASATARELGIPLTRVELNAAALDGFLELVEHADDPLADSSALAVWTLARHVARSHKVVVSGDGGDELFGGYLTYRATLWHRLLTSRAPAPIRRGIAGVAARLPTTEQKVSATYKLRRYLRALDLSPAIAHFTWNGTWLPKEAAALVRPAALKARTAAVLADLAASASLETHPSLSSLQAADLSEYLPNDILSKVDRMAMAHGLEVRAPLLNPSVAEFALALPDEMKTTLFGQGKRILRALARERYGLSIADAPKQGFSIPIHAWLRGPGRAHAEDLLRGPTLARIDIDTAQVARVLDAHMRGRSLGYEIWGLMVLAAWCNARLFGVRKPPGSVPARLSFESRAAGRLS